MKVLLSGGGTAGHIYPALTVAAQFAAEHDEVLFVGTPTGLEARLVPEAGIEFIGIKAAGYDRARPLTLITSSLRIAASTLAAVRLLRAMRPEVVVGFGAYVSIPVGLAARLTRTPLVLHEQNSVPGMANAYLSRWAAAVGVTYAESARLMARPDRVEVTGNPVRASVLRATRTRGRASLGLPEDVTVLLIFGGSRGARHVNSAALKLVDRLLALPRLHVVHIAGRAEYETVSASLALRTSADLERWHLVDYVDDMGLALASADLVVARAGATSIAEITALGLPSILVPYPYATDDHQTKNARTCVESGAAVLVTDSELDGERFGDELIAALGDPARRATMAAASRALGKPDAAERVVALARSSAKRGVRAD